jgi:hypothetical protein
MIDPRDEPDESLDEALARSRYRTARYNAWLAHLRASDLAFAEASAVYPADMNEWQSAVYLLTGCAEVWPALGRAVIEARSIAPLIQELENQRRASSHSEEQVMRCAAHFWDVDRWPAKFPYVFEQFYIYRWVVACHLYKHLPPRPRGHSARRLTAATEALR